MRHAALRQRGLECHPLARPNPRAVSGDADLAKIIFRFPGARMRLYGATKISNKNAFVSLFNLLHLVYLWRDHLIAKAKRVARPMKPRDLAAMKFTLGFSPKDVRTLRRRHMRIDPRVAQRPASPVIGTLSKFGDWLVRRYLGEFGADHAPESILFRMRSGVPYGESRLGGDFRLLRDMRRSGVLEAFAGGGDARAVSEKFGNSIDRSSFLFKTYNPVDFEKVRRTDAAARLEGRRRRNKT